MLLDTKKEMSTSSATTLPVQLSFHIKPPHSPHKILHHYNIHIHTSFIHLIFIPSKSQSNQYNTTIQLQKLRNFKIFNLSYMIPPMAMASSSNDDQFKNTTSTIDHHDSSSSSSAMITILHPDIINTHILTRLDGPALASAAASSSHLRRLCTQPHLWQAICTATWPSLTHPLAANTIASFPNTHRSIFSDSFPSLHPNHRHPSTPPSPPPPSPELISAVDIYYKGKPVFSRAHLTETRKGWFLCSPLWIDLLEPNEMVPMPLKFGRIEDDSWLRDLEENLGLSWIVIDPTRKRAANVSSLGAVLARRHWLTGDVEVVFAAEVEEEGAQCAVKVTCCGKAGGEMHVREVSLSMEDLEGRHVMGRESMVILQRAMESARRKRVEPVEAKESYERFCVMKRERREMRLRRERTMDTLIMLLALTVFALLFWILRFCV